MENNNSLSDDNNFWRNKICSEFDPEIIANLDDKLDLLQYYNDIKCLLKVDGKTLENIYHNYSFTKTNSFWKYRLLKVIKYLPYDVKKDIELLDQNNYKVLYEELINRFKNHEYIQYYEKMGY